MPQDNHTPSTQIGWGTVAEVDAMTTAEFRAWVKTLPDEQRETWRAYRRRLSKARYEGSEKRQWIWANPPFPLKEEEMAQLEPGLALEGEALRAFIAALPENLRDEFRRFRRRELGKRWRRENAEQHRAASKTAYERMRDDPERWEEYKARKREAMRERRRQESGVG